MPGFGGLLLFLGSLATTAVLVAGGFFGLQWLNAVLSGGSNVVVASQYLTTISVGGMLGGFVFSFMQPPIGRISLARFYLNEHSVSLGVLTDILIGLTAAYTLFFLLSGVFDFPTTSPADLSKVLKFFGLAIAAGLAGKAVLARIPSEIERRLTELQGNTVAIQEEQAQLKGNTEAIAEATAQLKEEKAQLEADFARTRMKLNLLLGEDSAQEGKRYADEGKIDEAEEKFAQAEALMTGDPDSPDALVAKGYLRKRQGRIQEAIEFCTQAIEKDANMEEAYYNRACYRCLDNRAAEEIVDDLRKAIELAPDNRRLAREDEDLAECRRNHPSVRALIGD